MDNLRRKCFLKNEIKKIMLKSLLNNSNIPLSYRYYSLYNRSKLTRLNSINQQKNKCVVTGRVWSTVKKTNYSRFVFRLESNNGNIPGFRRSS